MIKAVIWKGATLLAVSKPELTISRIAERHLFSLAVFEPEETIPTALLDMCPTWFVTLFQWEPEQKRTLAHFAQFLLDERQFNPERNSVLYVGDDGEDILLARRQQIMPLVVRTEEYRLCKYDGYRPVVNPMQKSVPVLPSAQFVPGWVVRQNRTAAAPVPWSGGHAA